MDEFRFQPVDIVERSHGRISKSNMSQWMNDRCKPSSEKIAMLSDIFGCNPNYLLCLTDDPTPVNMDSLTQEVQICDLMKKCYGSEAYEVVRMYLKLNDEGRKAAAERIEELTHLDKFVKRDSLTRKTAM
jgi:transcriptional regulator with XRE-family HTH domain